MLSRIINVKETMVVMMMEKIKIKKKQNKNEQARNNSVWWNFSSSMFLTATAEYYL